MDPLQRLTAGCQQSFWGSIHCFGQFIKILNLADQDHGFSRFPNLSTVGISDQTTLYCVGCSMHYSRGPNPLAADRYWPGRNRAIQ